MAAATISQEDWNFCLPLDLNKLQNERLRLVPFDSNPQHYASLYVQTTSQHPKVFDYLAYGPFPHPSSFLEWYNSHVRSDKGMIWFVILVRKCTVQGVDYPDDTYAGSTSYLNSSYEHASTEIGHINILPPFQRSFVATHMNAILLNYALNPVTPTSTTTPTSNPTSGLSLRRVQWQTNSQNTSSITAAKRLGYTYEGTIRWHRALPHGKAAAESHSPDKNPRLGERDTYEVGNRLGPGRDTVFLSICWDDWEGLTEAGAGYEGGEGVAGHIKRLLER